MELIENALNLHDRRGTNNRMIMTFPLDLPPHMSEIGLRLCCIMLCYYEQCVHGSTNFLYTEHRHPTCWISFEFRPLLDLLRLAIYIYIYIYIYLKTINYTRETHSGAVGWGIALQAGRSWVRIPIVSLEFFSDIILPAVL